MTTQFVAMPVMFNQPVLSKVEQAIAPNHTGWVKYQGSFWQAQFYRSSYQMTVKPGEWVKVVGRQGIRLLVVPVNNVSQVRACA
jgi:membrane-bound ClpP family serine protease